MSWRAVQTLGSLVVLMSLLQTPGAEAALPDKQTWLADVRVSMHGWRSFLDARIARADPDERLAVNLDIDNSALATRYAPGEAIGVVRRFTRNAHQRDVAIFFNTGRSPARAAQARVLLTRVGYPVDRLCHRRPGEGLVHGKKRCRRSFVAAGYTIVANVGNRSTDFVGGGYERGFHLPNYGGQLG